VQAVGSRDRRQEKTAQPRGGIPRLGSRRQPDRPFAARMAALTELSCGRAVTNEDFQARVRVRGATEPSASYCVGQVTVAPSKTAW